MEPEERGGDRHQPDANASQLLRSQRDANEQLVLAVLRAHEDADAAEAIATALKASEEQLRTFADTLPILSWYADPDGYVRWYNRRWFEYTGMALDEQEGWRWQSAHDPGDLPRIVAKWTAALENGEPWEDEFRLRRSDGQFRWFLSRAVPLHDGQGRVVRWFGTNVDIDDQKRAEATLRHRAMLATLAAEVGHAVTLNGSLRQVLLRCCASIVRQLEVARASVWTADPAGTTLVLAASEGASAHLDDSYTRIRVSDRMVGRIAATRTPYVTNDAAHDPHMDDREWVRRTGISAFAGYPLVVADKLVGVLVAFARRPLDEEDLAALASVANTTAVGTARIWEEGERARLLVSEQAARKQAEAANRVKDAFLATMSHELRTPLNAVLGWTLLLRREPYDETTMDQGLATIERNAQSQVRLVEDMLDVSRIISGQLRLEMHQVDMNAVARAAIDVVRPAADAKGVRLLVELPDQGGEEFLGDADRLQQIEWNLLSNAVKFSPRGGEVGLRIEWGKSKVCVTVRDTGVGIPSEHLPFVFERFRQVDSSTTRRHGGLGLGLAIVRHLVELHGGTITAESEGVGLGSTFKISLPRHAKVARSEEGPKNRARRARPKVPRGLPLLNGVNVLVIDDDEDSRSLLDRALSRAGALVNTADSASKALAFIQGHFVDVLISDIAMPGEDGFSLLQRVRALPASRGGEVPAIALTAYAHDDDAVRARRAGFQCHLPKPTDLDDLVRTVANLAAHIPLAT